MKEENWIDRLVRERWESFNKSKLKPILDNLGLKRGDSGFGLSGDSGYISFKLYAKNVEFREYYHNGKVYVFFGYDDNAGAWGGYTRKYEVTDASIFKKTNWMSLVNDSGKKASPDVVML